MPKCLSSTLRSRCTPLSPGRALILFLMLAILLSVSWITPDPVRAHHYFFPQVRSRIEQQIEAEIHKEGFTCRGELICGLQVIPAFYKERHFSPVWFDFDGLRPSAVALVQAMRQAGQDGLRPADYHLEAIDRLLAELSEDYFPPDETKAEQWADLDLILTDAYLLLGSHLSGGRIDPETLHADWIIGPRSLNMLEILNATQTEAQMLSALDGLKPSHRGYADLKQSLQHMRRLAKQDGWPQIPAAPTLRPGDAHVAMESVRQRLRLSGDLQTAQPGDAQPGDAQPGDAQPGDAQPGDAQPDDEQTDVYDALLVEAVKHFQSRHGLEPDGIIGQKTRETMNVTALQRVRQIELNLERWRWLPQGLGERYITVNTAGFYLRVVENDQIKLEMKVVVGRPARQTPVFSSTMTYMVLNPYWNVPRTIAVEDILPKLNAGVDYLINQSFKVFSGWGEDAVELDPSEINWEDYSKYHFPLRLRQEPGNKNALGRIKFMFPNKFAVYLHDTPQRSMFTRFQRGFSSGCIRLENAGALAAYLLADDPAWTAQRLRETLDSGRRRVVHVPVPITVHLHYMTAWVDNNGTLQFRKDIYKRDSKLDKALANRTPYDLPPLTASR